jgi:hypothetical protein
MKNCYIDIASLKYSGIPVEPDALRGRMQARLSGGLVILCLGAMAGVLGCAPMAPDLARQGAITVAHNPSRYSAHWSLVEVRRTESGTAISGEFRKRRLHLLVLMASGAVRTRQEAAEHLDPGLHPRPIGPTHRLPQAPRAPLPAIEEFLSPKVALID